ncbi:c-type heme family protein [Desulfovermiculus halophilus]|uniref:c-type heme family protein n=1 Tax=Desulfovermiculus halophilus TaxID=339722 RepID=UPI00054E2680|nr:DUF3365 domain-containing protein [Desulfovermiculus halophilus]
MPSGGKTSFRKGKAFSLQTRFIVVLVAAALGLGVIFFTILYFHMHSIVIQEVRYRANNMLDQVNAVQSYVRNVLRPRMFEELPDEDFILEAMSSSYISREVMQTTGEQSDLLYRRVATNPRNPKSAPNSRERELIRLFQEQPHRTRWENVVTMEGERYYLCARPVEFTTSCMRCHGEPSRAPRELIERYGSKRGFHHTPDSIQGLVSIGFPVQRAVLGIKEATFRYLFFYIVAVIIFFSLVHMYFRRLVVFNLKRLTSIFQRNFPEHHSENLVGQRTDGQPNDEVDQLVDGFEHIAGHLLEAREQLKEYAANLERMVSERTHELHTEVGERQADVHLFVHILDALRSSRDSEELLHRTLSLVGSRFKAHQVSYFCTQFSNRIYTWPQGQLPPELPQDFLDLAMSNQVRCTEHMCYVPVQSQEQIWGILYIDFPPAFHPERMSDQVLLALGQQLAIALENIQAFYSLMHQKELLESIFEGISDPLLLVDHNAGVVLANRAATDLMRDESHSGAADELFPVLGLESKDKRLAPRLISKSLTRQESWSEEVQLSNSRSFQISIYPIVGSHHPRGLAVCYLREVTAERAMKRQLQQAEKLSAVGKLAAGLAHEINNPLGTILCYVNLLKGSLDQSQSQQDLEVIERHTKRAQKILQDLLDFARPKAAGSGYCRLNQIISSSVQFLQVQAEKKGVEMLLELDAGDPLVACEESALEQILSNLLLNALEAVPESGWIQVGSTLHPEKDEAVLQVLDSGNGVPEDLLGTIFDPFFSTKEVGKGTGLGLAIVYGLVQDVGGRIEVDNVPGACFRIFFPLGATNE